MPDRTRKSGRAVWKNGRGGLAASELIVRRLRAGGKWIRTIGPPPEIVVDPSGSRRDHRAKYGCLSARPRVRCLCPPGRLSISSQSQCSTAPGLIAGTWHRPLFLTRDRWFESGSLQRRVGGEQI